MTTLAHGGAPALIAHLNALADKELKALFDEARRMGLDVLCEVHDRAELERAAALGATLIGVNSRNLHTMEVDAQTQLDLAGHLPARALGIAESGIRSGGDLGRLRAAGYRGFLVGESLMREADPAGALAPLLLPEPARP